jgi:hypothetical protein
MTNQLTDTSMESICSTLKVRHYVLIVNMAGGQGDNLIAYFASNPTVIAEVICEIFGGELYGPGSLADAEAALVGYGESELRYRIRSLNLWGAAFHTERIPDIDHLTNALRCSPAQIKDYLVRFI